MNPDIKKIITDFFGTQGAAAVSMEKLLNLCSDYKAKDVKNTVNEMIDDYELAVTEKKKKIITARAAGIYPGEISINKKGFGFVNIGDPEKGDVFVAPPDLMTAMNGDKVIVKITRHQSDDKNAEGYILKVTQRANARIIGRYEQLKNYGFVIPLSQNITDDIFIPQIYENGARNGDFVSCEIIKYPSQSQNAEGKIVRIIGDESDKDIYFKTILAEYDLPLKFPYEVKKAAEKMPAEIDPADFPGRTDFTNEIIFTIDGFDAKDLDDAISVEKLENGNYLLGVHIADVSEYVRENSVIDKEAAQRATSVYLVNTVIPMLPEELSNGICSLTKGVYRLTLSCVMEIDDTGKVVDSKVEKSIIKSSARLVYDDVSDYLENGDKGNIEETILEKLTLAKELALILMKAKHDRGAMDFDFPESDIVMDENGDVTDVFPEPRRIANKMIEEFMLMANETVAKTFKQLNVPFVYRIHEKPPMDKLTVLSDILKVFDYHIKISPDISPKTLQSLLFKIQGTKQQPLLEMMVLRSLAKAAYSPECLGHFSLSLSYYCHFTSPIRRYPDLEIHRIIKKYLDGKLDGKEMNRLAPIVENVSMQSSAMEERADKAERDTDDLRKAQYMKKFLGEVYEGSISGITNFGLFVMLDNTVEGMIRLADMKDDYYEFDEKNYRLVGEHGGKIYTIGDKIKIQVANASQELRKIDFIPYEAEN